MRKLLDARRPRVEPPVDPSPGRGLLRALRPRQWVKNVLVAAAPAAAGVLFELANVWPLLATFATFCAVSSAVYLLNDVADLTSDRAHPRKRHRPIAAGLVAPSTALAVAGVLAVGGLVGALLVRPLLGLVVLTYLAVSAGYSLGLKHVPVIDLLAVASGFVLRAAAGAAAIDIPVSSWFLTVMAFGALAMAAGKRSSELGRSGAEAGASRPVLEQYTGSFLLQVETVAIGGALVGYALWAFDPSARPGGPPAWLELSVVPFAAALLRYLWAISQGRAEAPEEAVFADSVLGCAVVVWTGLFLAGVAQR